MSFLSDEAELEGDFEDLEGDVDLNEWAAMGEDAIETLLEIPPEQTSVASSNKQSIIPKDSHSKTSEISSNPSQLHLSQIFRDSSHSNTIKAEGMPDAINLHVKVKTEPMKRKASFKSEDEIDLYGKSTKVESDILMAIESSGEQNDLDKDVEDKDSTDTKPTFTQEELRDLDACLVSEMMGGIKKQMFLRMPKGDRFVVAFAPVELADMADPSVQQLIESQANLAFFFNRQGKFKKKKGYAQAYFTQTSEVRRFMSKLMYVSLMEKNTEVSVSAIMNGGKHNVQVSFVLSSNNKSQLIMLLEKEDPERAGPISSNVSIQVEKISSEATYAVLMLLFPFSSFIDFKSEQSKDLAPGQKGPVNVHYANQQWLDAVMSCCSDFRYNGVSLKILRKEVPKPVDIQKPSIQVKREDRRLSLDSDKRSQSDLHEDSAQESSGRSRHCSSTSNISGSEKGDDDISNMTLDVCAGMMESLDKLKQMGTDNPNVLKILEMQSQLAALQKSLTKKNKSEHNKSTDDPQTSAMSNAPSDGEIKSEKHKGTEAKDRLPKKEDTKTTENKKKNASDKDLEILEAKLRESDKQEQERKQRIQNAYEEERKKAKELEELRKKNSAKQWIAEALQRRQSYGKTSEAAQKLLHSVADKCQEEQQNEKTLKVFQQKQAQHSAESSTSGQRSHVPLIEPRGERHDLPDQRWNKNTAAPDPGPLLFQNSFQPTTSFMENLPGRGPANKPLTSTPRVVGPDKSNVHQHMRRSDDDGLHSRLEEFQKELAQKGVVSPVKVHENYRSTISPDRPMHEGAPVYTEKEYHKRRKVEQLPVEFYIQTTFLPNRKCPVQGCPQKKNFKTEPMFLDHWDMFHKPTMTMRFCRHCTAYFVHPSELHAHLMKTHSINDHNMASQMVSEARVKIVSNPSCRDPGRFLAPPV